MTTPATPKTPDSPEDAPKMASLTDIMTAIDERIAAALGKLFDSGKADVTEGTRPGGDPAPGRNRDDVTATVRAEVQKLRDDEAKQAASQSLHERIEALEKALKAIPEAVPEEYRKITQRMWA